MESPRTQWRVVSDYRRGQYNCGAKAGDQVKLVRSFAVKDDLGNVIGPSYAVGDFWFVLYGSDDDPTVVWLSAPDGSIHTWSDDSDFWAYFEKV